MFLEGQNDYETKSYTKGDVLFKEGDKIRSLYLLKSGKMIFVGSNNDRYIPLHSLSDRGVIAEDCIFTKESIANYSAVFLDNSNIVEIPKADIMSYINDSADWIKTILTDMADKCNKTQAMVLEHKIIDEKLSGDESFTEEMESLVRKALNPK